VKSTRASRSGSSKSAPARGASTWWQEELKGSGKSGSLKVSSLLLLLSYFLL